MEKQPLMSGVDNSLSDSIPTILNSNVLSQPPPGDNFIYCGGSTQSWPPPPGYYPSVMPSSTINHVPSYGSTETTTVNIPQAILVGGCPACRVGIMEDDFTCLGLLCAILFFPVGLICCLLLKTRRCSNCGAYFVIVLVRILVLVVFLTFESTFGTFESQEKYWQIVSSTS